MHQDILWRLSQLDLTIVQRLEMDAIKISQKLKAEGGETTGDS